MALLKHIKALIMAQSMSPTAFNDMRKDNPYFGDKFSGKTVRNKSRRKPRGENSIVTHTRNTVYSSGGATMIPVTEIDKQFDVLKKSSRHNGAQESFVMNDKQHWESLEDSLAQSGQYTTKFNPRSGIVEEIFKIPVTDMLTIPVSSDGCGSKFPFEKKMFTISGKEYDPSFLYAKTDTEFMFNQVAPLVIPMPAFQNEGVAITV